MNKLFVILIILCLILLVIPAAIAQDTTPTGEGDVQATEVAPAPPDMIDDIKPIPDETGDGKFHVEDVISFANFWSILEDTITNSGVMALLTPIIVLIVSIINMFTNKIPGSYLKTGVSFALLILIWGFAALGKTVFVEEAIDFVSLSVPFFAALFTALFGSKFFYETSVKNKIPGFGFKREGSTATA